MTEHRTRRADAAPLLGRAAVLGTFIVSLTILGLAAPAEATPGDPLWDDYFGGPAYGVAQRVLIATDGRAYVMGVEDTNDYNNDEYVVQSVGPTGQYLWKATFNGNYDPPAADTDVPHDIAFGPTEQRIYVTGYSEGRHSKSDWATVAYRTDGTQLWVRRYNDPAGGVDSAKSLAVSSRSGRIFVTGTSHGSGTGRDVTTIAYSPNGDRLWTRTFDAAGNGPDDPAQVLVDPGGGRLYVVASCHNGGTLTDICVIAYQGNGSRLWLRTYDGPSSGEDLPASAVLSPSGRRLYLCGQSEGNYLTSAYRRDGTRLWSVAYDGPSAGYDFATESTLTPDGQTLYVTGTSAGSTDDDVVTVAYTRNGNQAWVSRYDSGATDAGGAIALNPAGDHLYVASSHDSTTTVAYDAGGTQLWARNEGEVSAGYGDIAVSPGGTTVITVGWTRDVYTDGAIYGYSVL